MINRLASLIFGPGPSTPDTPVGTTPRVPKSHIGPKPPTFNPSDFLETPKSFPPEGVEIGNIRNVPRKSATNWNDTFRRRVCLFGVDMSHVRSDQFTETWNASFGLISVLVKFDARNTPQPWTAQVTSEYQITSNPIDDVRFVERWAEKALLRIREQIPAGPPHMIAEQRRREGILSKTWSPLPRQPLELECFAVKADDGEYCIIQKALFPRGEYKWMTQLSKVTAVWSWEVILSKFSHYYELPPLQ